MESTDSLHTLNLASNSVVADESSSDLLAASSLKIAALTLSRT